MSLRKNTPCDYGICPYEAEYYYTCEYWCGAVEPEDYPEDYEEYDDCDYEVGFDAYMGCFTDDC